MEDFVKFESIQQVQKAFKKNINKKEYMTIKENLKYDDIEKYSPEIERILESNYNKVSGASLLEILSTVIVFKQSDEIENALKQKDIEAKELAIQEDIKEVDKWLQEFLKNKQNNT